MAHIISRQIIVLNKTRLLAFGSDMLNVYDTMLIDPMRVWGKEEVLRLIELVLVYNASL